MAAQRKQRRGVLALQRVVHGVLLGSLVSIVQLAGGQGTPGTGTAAPEAGELTVKEQPFVDVPPDAKDLIAVIAGSSQHVAWREKLGTGWVVVLDGKRSHTYQKVEYLNWTRDGKSVVFDAKEANTSFLVTWESGREERRPGRPWRRWQTRGGILSPDGTRTAQIGRQNEVVLHDELSGTDVSYPKEKGAGNVEWEWMEFSPSGRRFAFTRCRVLKGCLLSVDGKAVPIPGPPGVIEDERGELETFARPSATTVVSGRRFLFSPDESKLAVFSAVSSRHRLMPRTSWAVFLDGREVAGGFEDLGRAAFSPDSQHFAFSARKGRDWVVVLDGTELAPFGSGVTPPVFSSDGQKVAYAGGETDRDAFEVINREKTHPVPLGDKFVVNRRQLLPSMQGGGLLGAIGATLYEKTHRRSIVEKMLFGPQGELAYVVVNGSGAIEYGGECSCERYVVRGGKKSKAFKAKNIDSLRFDAQGHLGYEVHGISEEPGIEKSLSTDRVVVDDREYQGRVLHGTLTIVSDKFVWLTVKDGKVYRVECE
jgi:hypothetical protein